MKKGKNFNAGTFTTVPNLGVLAGESPLAQVIYLWVNAFTDDELKCFPSHATLARASGLSKRTVVKELETLKKLGLIKIDNRKTHDGGHASRLITVVNKGEKSPTLWEKLKSLKEESVNTPIAGGAIAPPIAGDAIGIAGDAIGIAGDAIPYSRRCTLTITNEPKPITKTKELYLCDPGGIANGRLVKIPKNKKDQTGKDRGLVDSKNQTPLPPHAPEAEDPVVFEFGGPDFSDSPYLTKATESKQIASVIILARDTLFPADRDAIAKKATRAAVLEAIKAYGYDELKQMVATYGYRREENFAPGMGSNVYDFFKYRIPKVQQFLNRKREMPGVIHIPGSDKRKYTPYSEEDRKLIRHQLSRRGITLSDAEMDAHPTIPKLMAYIKTIYGKNKKR